MTATSEITCDPALLENVVEMQFRDVAAYLLTAGFSHAAFLPVRALRGLMRFEQVLPAALMQKIVLGMVVALERVVGEGLAEVAKGDEQQ